MNKYEVHNQLREVTFPLGVEMLKMLRIKALYDLMLWKVRLIDFKDDERDPGSMTRMRTKMRLLDIEGEIRCAKTLVAEINNLIGLREEEGE